MPSKAQSDQVGERQVRRAGISPAELERAAEYDRRADLGLDPELLDQLTVKQARAVIFRSVGLNYGEIAAAVPCSLCALSRWQSAPVFAELWDQAGVAHDLTLEDLLFRCAQKAGSDHRYWRTLRFALEHSSHRAAAGRSRESREDLDTDSVGRLCDEALERLEGGGDAEQAQCGKSNASGPPGSGPPRRESHRDSVIGN